MSQQDASCKQFEVRTMHSIGKIFLPFSTCMTNRSNGSRLAADVRLLGRSAEHKAWQRRRCSQPYPEFR